MRPNFTYMALGALVVLAIAGGVVMTALPSGSRGDIQVVEVAPTATFAPTSVPMPSERQVGVYVSGAVANPGVYVVGEGSRLADVLLLAGGASAEADLTAVNLAAVVRDEDHWHVPKQGETSSADGGLVASGRDGGQGAGMTAEGRVDLNGADVETLKTLPGIGEVRARAIVGYREANGDFGSVDGLLEVDGIGVGIVEDIRELVSVE